MAKTSIIHIASLTFLLANFANAMNRAITVTAPLETHHHHVDSGRCEDMLLHGLSLNLRDVGLRRVESGFANSADISCLSLEDNDIAYVSPTSLNMLPNLIYLNLARNSLSLVDFSKLQRHPHLRTLILDENTSEEGITIEFVNSFPELTYVYLRNCSIDDIESLSFAPELLYLNLSTNNLANSKLTFISDAPSSLITLDLTNNGIQNFNASGLSSVTRLRLDGNKFERLCGKVYCNEGMLVLEGATSLQWFSASRNLLTSVDSDAFDDNVNIGHLDLSRNKIDNIQKGTFEKLDELKYLSLEDNKLNMIPELCNLESLQYLYLGKNYLHTLNNESFCQIENLKLVDLSDNRIKFVEADALDKLTHLEVLKLSNNLLTTFASSWLEQLTALRSLHVDGNQLKSLGDLGLGSLRSYARLERVFAQNNLIHRLYTGSLFSEVRNQPNVTILLFDPDVRGHVVGSNGDDCRCDCDVDNEISLLK